MYCREGFDKFRARRACADSAPLPDSPACLLHRRGHGLHIPRQERPQVDDFRRDAVLGGQRLRLDRTWAQCGRLVSLLNLTAVVHKNP